MLVLESDPLVLEKGTSGQGADVQRKSDERLDREGDQDAIAALATFLEQVRSAVAPEALELRRATGSLADRPVDGSSPWSSELGTALVEAVAASRAWVERAAATGDFRLSGQGGIPSLSRLTTVTDAADVLRAASESARAAGDFERAIADGDLLARLGVALAESSTAFFQFEIALAVAEGAHVAMRRVARDPRADADVLSRALASVESARLELHALNDVFDAEVDAALAAAPRGQGRTGHVRRIADSAVARYRSFADAKAPRSLPEPLAGTGEDLGVVALQGPTERARALLVRTMTLSSDLTLTGALLDLRLRESSVAPAEAVAARRDPLSGQTVVFDGARRTLEFRDDAPWCPRPLEVPRLR